MLQPLEVYLLVSYIDRNKKKNKYVQKRLHSLSENHVDHLRKHASVAVHDITAPITTLNIEGKDLKFYLHSHTTRGGEFVEGLEKQIDPLQPMDSSRVGHLNRFYFHHIVQARLLSTMDIFVYNDIVIHLRYGQTSVVYRCPSLDSSSSIYSSKHNSQKTYFRGWVNYKRNCCFDSSKGKVYYLSDEDRVIVHDLKYHTKRDHPSNGSDRSEARGPEQVLVEEAKGSISISIDSRLLYLLLKDHVMTICDIRTGKKLVTRPVPYGESGEKPVGNCIVQNDKWIVTASYIGDQKYHCVFDLFNKTQHRRRVHPNKFVHSNTCMIETTTIPNSSSNSVHNMNFFVHHNREYILAGFIFQICILSAITTSGKLVFIGIYGPGYRGVAWNMIPRYNMTNQFILGGSSDMLMDLIITIPELNEFPEKPNAKVPENFQEELGDEDEDPPLFEYD